MILIVDDTRANIIALKKILQLHNLPVDTAESGEEALKKILKTNYSLIIMDVQMPGMDGYEVVEILMGSNRTKDIPVIFLSAVNIQKKFISRGYESGGVDYITKPADPDLLILKVKTFLKLSEQKNELKQMRDILAAEVEIRKKAQQELARHNELLEEKIAERTAELTAKNEELEFRNHELQQFTWVVSHDLKEPVRKITLFNKIIQERYLIDDEKAMHYCERTILASQRMMKLIDDLINYARLSSNTEFRQTNLDEVVNEVVSDFDFLIEESNAKIHIGPLPRIRAIESQVRQLFQNLIGNSLKFIRPGTLPQIEVKSELVESRDFDAAASPNGKFCRITVSDNGIGFEQKYVEKVFVIFQSLNDKKSYEGTGIGLAIAKKIIEMHNGIITAYSKVGEGTRFVLVLPV